MIPSPAAALRQRISHVLFNDSALNAFCIDYFSDVYRRFTNGMDRVHKVNLLLEYAGLDELAAVLAEQRRQ